MTKNIFLEKFRAKSKKELLDILSNREKYTSESIEAAEIVLNEKYSDQPNVQQLKIKEKPLIERPILINKTKDLKFYSQKSIGIATFLGGPLAAGYLIRENYLSLNKPDEGKKSLLIGIISTVILFTVIFMIPESILDNTPNKLIPAIYTGIALIISAKIHGTILHNHKENENEFYSGWNAAGIGLISGIILLIGVLGYTFLAQESAEYELHETEMALFYKNETESLVFYDHLNTETDYSLQKELENKTIPTWKENIEIIEKTNKIENLPPELLQLNTDLLKYSKLRLKGFELLNKALSEQTDKYRTEIQKIHQEIEHVLQNIN